MESASGLNLAVGDFLGAAQRHLHRYAPLRRRLTSVCRYRLSQKRALEDPVLPVDALLVLVEFVLLGVDVFEVENVPRQRPASELARFLCAAAAAAVGSNGSPSKHPADRALALLSKELKLSPRCCRAVSVGGGVPMIKLAKAFDLELEFLSFPSER